MSVNRSRAVALELEASMSSSRFNCGWWSWIMKYISQELAQTVARAGHEEEAERGKRGWF